MLAVPAKDGVATVAVMSASSAARATTVRSLTGSFLPSGMKPRNESVERFDT